MPTDQILNRGQRIAWLDNVKMFAMPVSYTHLGEDILNKFKEIRA